MQRRKSLKPELGWSAMVPVESLAPVGSEADESSGKTAPSLLVPSQWLNDWSKDGKGGGKEKAGSTC